MSDKAIKTNVFAVMVHTLTNKHAPLSVKNVRNVKKKDIVPVAAKLNLKPLFHPETEPIIFSPRITTINQNYRQPLNNVAHSPQPVTTSTYSYNDDGYLFAVQNIFNKEKVVEQSEKVNMNRIVKIAKVKE